MNTIYQLGFEAADCDATVLLNGFPVLRCSAGSSAVAGLPANPYLIGNGNVLQARIDRAGPEARLDGSIACAGQGEIVAIPGPDGFDLAAGATASHRFDSPGIDCFARLLERARPLSRAAATAAGIAIRDALRRGDAAAFTALQQQKITDFAAAFGVGAAQLAEQLAPLALAMLQADLSFEPADIAAAGYCDDRVWGLQVQGQPLLRVHGADGTESLEVFVADLGDGPCIVR